MQIEPVLHAAGCRQAIGPRHASEALLGRHAAPGTRLPGGLPTVGGQEDFGIIFTFYFLWLAPLALLSHCSLLASFSFPFLFFPPFDTPLPLVKPTYGMLHYDSSFICYLLSPAVRFKTGGSTGARCYTSIYTSVWSQCRI